MATSEGGGPEFMSTLNPQQKKLMTELFNFLSGKIGKGATASKLDVVSGQEEGILGDILETARDSTDTDAARKTLTSIAEGEVGPQEITREAAGEFFQKGIANPLLKDVEDRLLPQARRSVAGFSTRRARAVRNVLQDTTETLAGEASRIELARQQMNAAIAQNRVQNRAAAAQALPGLNMQRAGFLSGAGSIASGFTMRRHAEEARMRAENNPWTSQLLQTIGMKTGEIVEMPAETTGFGTAMSGLSAGASTFAAATTGGASMAVTGPPDFSGGTPV